MCGWLSRARIWRSARKRRWISVRVHPALDELEGDPLLELPVGPLGEVHHAHAAAGQLAHQSVGADPEARRALSASAARFAGEPPGVDLEEASGGGVGPEKRLDLPPDRGLAGAGPPEPTLALASRYIQRLIEQPVDVVPAVACARGHSASS